MQFGILYIWSTASYVDGKEPDAIFLILTGCLIFSDDHNRWVTYARTRILGWGSFGPTRYHHAYVNIVGYHVVCADGLINFINESFRRSSQS